MVWFTKCLVFIPHSKIGLRSANISTLLMWIVHYNIMLLHPILFGRKLSKWLFSSLIEFLVLHFTISLLFRFSFITLLLTILFLLLDVYVFLFFILIIIISYSLAPLHVFSYVIILTIKIIDACLLPQVVYILVIISVCWKNSFC